MGDQLHHQERHVRHRIGRAEGLVELDAVDDEDIRGRRAIGKEIDVIEPQVAVRVAGHPPRDPGLDQRLELREGLLGERGEAVEHRPADRATHLPLRLLQIIADEPGDVLEPGELRDPLVPLRPRMERGDPPAQLLDHVRLEIAAFEDLLQPRLIRQPPHLDGPFDDLSRPLHADPISLPDDRHDPQVNLRRQPTVQPDLLLAEVPPPLERAVIDEPQAYRLLDLVRERPGQADDRDVRLADDDPFGARPEGRGSPRALINSRDSPRL